MSIFRSPAPREICQERPTARIVVRWPEIRVMEPGEFPENPETMELCERHYRDKEILDAEQSFNQ